MKCRKKYIEIEYLYKNNLEIDNNNIKNPQINK